MKINGVHISLNNTKLGAAIPSINLPVGYTCRPDAPCFKKCYARKGRFAFSRNKALLEGNFDVWKSAPHLYEMAAICACTGFKFFRWHSAGDIPDMSYLQMMVRVAKACPEVTFLCFTKKYGLINTYLDANELPLNLTIVFSAWQKFLPENPYDLPIAYIRLKHDDGGNSLIPDDAHQCPGFCGACAETECSCWRLERGQSVVFDEH